MKYSVCTARGRFLICLALCLFTLLGAALPAMAENADWTGSATFSQEGVKVTGEGLEWKEGTLQITKGGTYQLSGTAQEARIKVKVGKKQEVLLVLAGLNLSHTTGPVMEISSGKSVTLELSENGENSLICGTRPENVLMAGEGEKKASAAVLSESDLTIRGSGSLTIGGYLKHGLNCEKALTLESGTLTIEAVSDAIRAEGVLTLSGGEYTLLCGGQGIRVSDGKKSGATFEMREGSLTIDAAQDAVCSEENLSILGGRLMLKSGDVALKAEAALTVSGGEILIPTCVEGLESKHVRVESGSLHIIASDDGINASGANKNDHSPMLEIAGGDIYISADGDGLDSNGTLLIEGGRLIIDGPDVARHGALDSDLDCLITGGVVLAIGNAQKPQTFTRGSTQCFVTFYAAFREGSALVLTDANGVELYRHTAEKSGAMVVFSTPEIQSGEKILLWVDGETAGEALAADAR